MALTTTYSVTPLLERIFPAVDPASNSDTVALNGGGFATVADVPGGISVPVFYDAAGNQQPQVISAFAPDAKIAQLTDGTVAIVGAHSGGGIDFVRQTATGVIVGTPLSIDTGSGASNPDIAARADGGFVVAYQYDYGAGAGNDIVIYNSGASYPFDVDASSANDQNASVAGLNDGGFAVAWDRIDADGNSMIWYAVYNHDGSVRKPPAEFQSGHQANVTALQSGGFAIGLEKDVFHNGQTDIVVAGFGSAGQPLNYGGSVVSQLPTDDSETAVTQLSNGMVLSTFTNLFDAVHGDHDIRGALVDPVTGSFISNPGDPLKIDSSADDNSQSSVSAFGLAQFVVSYSSNTTGDVSQKTFQLVRTVTGDAAADSFTGDDAVDIVNGLGGSDNLAGGANNDTLNGGDGNDRLVGGNGNDSLNGGTGADALLGGPGNDAYFVDNASDAVDESSAALGAGIDTVNAYISINLSDGNHFTGNIENVALRSAASINATGNSLANTLNGNSGVNTLSGLGGNDTLDGKEGADTMQGGLGNDTYYVDNAGDHVVELNGQGTDKVQAYVSFSLSGQELENLALRSSASINGTGNSIANIITGNSGNNIIDGLGGADTMSGSTGNDTYYVDNAGDHVVELNGQGTDNVQAYVSFNLSGQELENLQLRSAANINGTGNSIANIIAGNSGNNVINGLGGNDTLSGAQGQDNFVFTTALNAATNVDHISDFSVVDDTIQLDNAVFAALGGNGTLTAAAFHIGAVATTAAQHILYDSANGWLSYDADGNGAGAANHFATLTMGLAMTNNDFLVV
ncbi:calcium-binding protein [Mesorhizobium sophorae]|uniref:calcium-binding protein n=1 Tax=Mesorhizobium sophorae TaxID=1300294 RepID=UPI00142D7989|nr:calcium-binding protein [Mesorhizobium sophorae]